RIRGKRPLHGAVGIRVATAREDMRADLRFELHLRSLRAIGQRVHARAAIGVLYSGSDRGTHTNQRQDSPADKLNLITELVVKIDSLHQQALIEERLLNPAIVASARLP